MRVRTPSAIGLLCPKKISLFVLAFFCLLQGKSQSYCAASGPDCGVADNTWIESIQLFSGFYKPATGCGTTSPGYSNFVTDTIKIINGDALMMAEGGAPFPDDLAEAYIDWNADGDFDDLDETVVLATSGLGLFAGTITIPAGISDGFVTRLRIRDYWSEDVGVGPCGTTNHGEVEDYMVQVGESSSPSSAYCNSIGLCTAGAIIENVSVIGDFGSYINNSTGCNKYSDFTKQRFTVSAGNTYSLSVTIPDVTVNTSVNVFVDWNEDYIFDYATELYPAEIDFVSGNVIATISPVGDFAGGFKRLRVVTGDVGFSGGTGGVETSPYPCDTVGGETEDYTVLYVEPLDTVPNCVDLTQVTPANGKLDVCQGTTIRWNTVVNAASYKFSLWQGNTAIETNKILTNNFYRSAGLLVNSANYRWLVIPVTAGGKEGMACDTLSFTVSGTQDPKASILPAFENSVCVGTTLQLNGSPSLGTTPYKHSWNGTRNSLLSDTAIVNPVFTATMPLGRNYYEYSVWDTRGCMALDSVYITINDAPVAGTTVALTNDFCPGKQTELKITGSTGTISWESASLAAGPFTTVALTVSPTDPTVFTTPELDVTTNFRAVLTIGSCVVYGNVVEVRVQPSLERPKIAAAPAGICQGQSMVLSVSNYTSDISWNDEDASQTRELTVTRAGGYVATVNINGCKASSLVKSVALYSNPAKPEIILNGTNPTCVGGVVNLVSSISGNNTWSTGASGLDKITIAWSGDYTVTQTNANGCTTTSDVYTMVFNPKPSVPVISALTNAPYCDGQTVQLKSSSPEGNVWNNGSVTDKIAVTESGTHSVVVTNTYGCSAKSSSFQITFSTTPPVPSITTSAVAPYCDGETLILYSSSSDNNRWSNGSTQNNIPVTSTASFVVSVVLPSGCSSTSSPLLVEFRPTPLKPSLSQEPAGPMCAGIPVTLTSDLNGGNKWSTGSNENSITITNSGTYTVSNVNGFGCESELVSLEANFEAIPAQPELIQEVDTLKVIDVTAASYQWFNIDGLIDGATDNKISPTKSGYYFVVAYSAGGCASKPSNAKWFSGTGIADNSQDSKKIQLYPNPNNGSFKVDVPVGFSGDYTVEDITGKKVGFGKISDGSNAINLSLAKGTYLLRVVDNSQQFWNRLIVE